MFQKKINSIALLGLVSFFAVNPALAGDQNKLISELLSKPKMTFELAMIICNKKKEQTLRIKHINLDEVKKGQSLDINGDKIINKSDKLLLNSALSKLTKPENGINCALVNEISQKIAQSTALYKCRAISPSIATVWEHPLYQGEQVVAGSLGVKGAMGSGGDIFVQNGGKGFIEFINLEFAEITEFQGIGNGGDSYANLIAKYDLLSQVFDKYEPTTSFTHPNNPSPQQFAISSWSFKKCGSPNRDPGHVAKAFCELKDLNGIVYSEPTLAEQVTSFHYGYPQYCVN